MEDKNGWLLLSVTIIAIWLIVLSVMAIKSKIGIEEITLSSLVNDKENEYNGLRWECRFPQIYWYDCEGTTVGNPQYIGANFTDWMGQECNYYGYSQDESCKEFILVREMG